MKKKTLEEAQKIFKDGGCELLATEYKGNRTSMPYICECGNESKIRLNGFQSGKRCKECGIKKRADAQRFSLEQVQKIFKAGGCTLLATEYENSHTPMPYICKCGKEFSKTFEKFKKSWRCKVCRYKQSSKSRRLPFSEVKQAFEHQGLTLLETTYENSMIPMKCLCACGQKHNATYNSVYSGHGKCGTCAGNQKHTYEYINEQFDKSGCKLLSSSYEGAHVLMDYICKCNRKSEITWGNFRSGRRCKQCATQELADAQRFDYEFVKSYFEEQGCHLLAQDYVNCTIKMRYICECGIKSKITFQDFRSGRRCKKCGCDKAVIKIKRQAEERFFKRAPIIHNNKYDYSQSVYIAARVPIDIICPIHGIWSTTTPNSHLKETGCPRCNESRGEKAIREHLEKFYGVDGIRWKSQLRLKKSPIKLQKCDFALKTSNGLIMLEYDGDHHYYPVQHSRTKRKNTKGFYKGLKCDLKKRKFYKRKNFPLFVIPYWEFKNISRILDDLMAGREPQLTEPIPDKVKKYAPMREEMIRRISDSPSTTIKNEKTYFLAKQ